VYATPTSSRTGTASGSRLGGLSFSGPVAPELDPGSHALGSFGLEVTTGGAGFDHEAFAAALDVAREVGI
jgi:hypothetical protein